MTGAKAHATSKPSPPHPAATAPFPQAILFPADTPPAPRAFGRGGDFARETSRAFDTSRFSSLAFARRTLTKRSGPGKGANRPLGHWLTEVWDLGFSWGSGFGVWSLLRPTLHVHVRPRGLFID